MTKHSPTALVSYVQFYTDMTSAKAPSIPLAVMLEVVWPAKGRWFGLVGRSALSEREKGLVSLSDFPELAEPWPFLSKLFTEAWDQKAGKSGSWLSGKFRWALNVTPPEILHIPEIEHPEKEWPQVTSQLLGTLDGLANDKLSPPLIKAAMPSPVLMQREMSEIERVAA